MALDTNIALGVRPVEQPNMLAQMGQMMQLRQAQQGSAQWLGRFHGVRP